MFFFTAQRLASLPFSPMSLITLDVLQQRLQQRNSSSSSSSSSLPDAYVPDDPASFSWSQAIDWFDGGAFFISPKHDGVRLVSYVDPKSAHKQQRRLSSSIIISPPTTCFSRHGRVVAGLTWIEQEMQMLRHLCGDALLILDGELYLHTGGATRAAHDDDDDDVVAGDDDDDVARGGARFKTGFLAVSALVHRLRGGGATAAFTSAAEILRHVPTLPKYCLFDVASYNPPTNPSIMFGASSSSSSSSSSSLSEEYRRVWSAAVEACRVDDVESLRVVPNVTPFSQRLRTLSFLATLLQIGMRSAQLRSSLVWPVDAPSSSSSTEKHTRQRSSSSSSCGAWSYVGGEHVVAISHRLLHSLHDAKDVELPDFIKQGYEGAVVRTPTNVYEMHPKRSRMLHDLMAAHTSSPTSTPTKKLKTTTTTAPPNISPSLTDEGFATLALQRVRHLAPRAQTSVKLLAYTDAEFPVLRPLLKPPSTNPRTRPLLHVRADEVSEQPHLPRRASNAANKAAARKAKTLVFYGLQCLTESGRVFSVSLPKLSHEHQRELLNHLLHAGRNSSSSSTRRRRRTSKPSSSSSSSSVDAGARLRSLTGLYATVKYATMTEHGIPRFSTIKAIRGGKGWFL